MVHIVTATWVWWLMHFFFKILLLCVAIVAMLISELKLSLEKFFRRKNGGRLYLVLQTILLCICCCRILTNHFACLTFYVFSPSTTLVISFVYYVAECCGVAVEGLHHRQAFGHFSLFSTKPADWIVVSVKMYDCSNDTLLSWQR